MNNSKCVFPVSALGFYEHGSTSPYSLGPSLQNGSLISISKLGVNRY